MSLGGRLARMLRRLSPTAGSVGASPPPAHASGTVGTEREAIRAEVERLAPWYYAFDLHGVRTDLTAPCDHHGHRRVTIV